MSGVWSAVLNLDLVIPSNKQPVPGSGAVYLGGPRLPVGLKNVYKGALVFFSDAAGLAAGIDYWYIAHFGSDIAPFTADGLQIGYYPTGGPDCIPNYGGYISVGDGSKHVVLEAIDDILVTSDGAAYLRSNKTGPAAVQILAPNAQNVVIGEGVGVGQPRVEFKGWNGGAGSDIYIRASDSNQDQWFTNTSSQTVGGVANCPVIFDWRITPDYIVEVRLRVTAAVPPFGAAFALNVTAPAGMPLPDSGPGTGIFVNSWGNVGAYNGANVIPLTGRLNATGIVDVFSQGLANLRDFSGAFVFTKAKP